MSEEWQKPGPWLTCPRREDQHHSPLFLSSLQDTEIINTAILTGRTVAIPVKVIAIEVTGLVLDVSALVECESDNEDIIKVGFLKEGAVEEGFRPLEEQHLKPESKWLILLILEDCTRPTLLWASTHPAPPLVQTDSFSAAPAVFIPAPVGNLVFFSPTLGMSPAKGTSCMNMAGQKGKGSVDNLNSIQQVLIEPWYVTEQGRGESGRGWGALGQE
jgi:hypothetical protein